MGGAKAKKKGVSPKKVQAKEKEKDKNTLKKAFQKKGDSTSTSSAAAAAATPSRQQTSLFLTYLRATSKGKDKRAANQAVELAQHYATLDGDSKRALIGEFFRVGGKKAGLCNAFSQSIHTKEAATEGTWSGYVTPSKCMELEGVLGVVPWSTCPNIHQALPGQHSLNSLNNYQSIPRKNILRGHQEQGKTLPTKSYVFTSALAPRLKRQTLTPLMRCLLGTHSICDEFIDERHPDKPHENFKLQKRWYSMDKGIDASRLTEVGEKFDRSAAEMPAALGSRMWRAPRPRLSQTNTKWQWESSAKSLPSWEGVCHFVNRRCQPRRDSLAASSSASWGQVSKSVEVVGMLHLMRQKILSSCQHKKAYNKKSWRGWLSWPRQWQST